MEAVDEIKLDVPVAQDLAEVKTVIFLDANEEKALVRKIDRQYLTHHLESLGY